jgi:glycine hydroxymethyltransferase
MLSGTFRSVVAPTFRRTAPRCFSSSVGSALNKSLEETDPELLKLIEQEKARQRNSLVLIASENFTSKAVLDVSKCCIGLRPTLTENPLAIVVLLGMKHGN